MRPLAPVGLSSLPQEFVASLPGFAVVVGLLALIWLACAVVATVGVYFAGMIFFAARWIVDACRRTIQRHWGPVYAHLVTIDSTGVRTRPVTGRRARRWHTRPTTSTTTTDAATDAPGKHEPGTPGRLQRDVPRDTQRDDGRGSDNAGGGEPS